MDAMLALTLLAMLALLILAILLLLVGSWIVTCVIVRIIHLVIKYVHKLR